MAIAKFYRSNKMNANFRRHGRIPTLLVLSALAMTPHGAIASSTNISTTTPIQETVKMVASGTFDITLTPQPSAPGIEAAKLGRQTIAKRFHGDLDATSQGEMLATHTAVKGSAGYVALERVSGALGGRQGSFALQHSGTMHRGAAQLTLTVVPDSGTDALTGLSGAMAIRIENGQHFYTFDYALPPADAGAAPE